MNTKGAVMTEQEAMKRYTVGLNGTAFNGMFECDEGTWMKFEDVEQPLKNEARRKELIVFWEKTILEDEGIGSNGIWVWQVVIKELKKCEVDDG